LRRAAQIAGRGAMIRAWVAAPHFDPVNDAGRLPAARRPDTLSHRPSEGGVISQTQNLPDAKWHRRHVGHPMQIPVRQDEATVIDLFAKCQRRNGRLALLAMLVCRLIAVIPALISREKSRH